MTSDGPKYASRVIGWQVGRGLHSGSDQRQESKDHPSADLHKHQDSSSWTLQGQTLSYRIPRRSCSSKKEEEAVFPHHHSPWMRKLCPPHPGAEPPRLPACISLQVSYFNKSIPCLCLSLIPSTQRHKEPELQSVSPDTR